MSENRKQIAKAIDEARSFEVYSQRNAGIVSATFDCGCEPYRTVFTADRWKAQGFAVKASERSRFVLLDCVRKIRARNGRIVRQHYKARVFCAHQVTSSNGGA